MSPSTRLLWLSYAVVALCAWRFDRHPAEPAGGPGGLVVLAVLAAFLAYSLYCSTREDLLRSLRQVGTLHWGRQLGLDLYLGLCLSLLVIYLNEGSLLVTLLWLAPSFVYGNLATLLYFGLHFDMLARRLAG